MGTRWQIVSRVALFCFVLLAPGFITSCAPTVFPLNPPETYKGPMAERPVMQQGDFWVYERANTTRAKTTAVAANVGFPLWIGRRWSYEGSAVRAGQPATSPSRITTAIDCDVMAFKQVTVAAGAFEAFECECRCTHLSPGYEPGCGQWTVWYAPDVKNIIKVKTGSTESSMELIEYKASRPAPSTKAPPGKAS